MADDPKDRMIRQVARNRRPDVPLFITCAEVFYASADEVMADGGTAGGMAKVGFVSIKDAEGVPTLPDGKELFPWEVAARFGDDYDVEVEALTTEQFVRLCFVGFVTLAAEALLKAQQES